MLQLVEGDKTVEADIGIEGVEIAAAAAEEVVGIVEPEIVAFAEVLVAALVPVVHPAAVVLVPVPAPALHPDPDPDPDPPVFDSS